MVKSCLILTDIEAESEEEDDDDDDDGKKVRADRGPPLHCVIVHQCVTALQLSLLIQL